MGSPSLRRSGIVATFFLAVLAVALAPDAVASTLSVNCDSGGDLQAKINSAAAGSTILVKGTCFGNFQILSKGLTLKGNPTATLDGNDLFVTLEIDAPGKAVHLVGLTITGGAANGGSGIWKLDGVLTLDRVTVTGNLASNTFGEAVGGGIFSTKGNVTLVHSTISGNRVLATDTADTALGGGLFVQQGNLTITDSKIAGNRVSAHPSSGTATARGGGFQFLDGVLKVKGTTISDNRISASAPGASKAEGSAAWDSSSLSASFSATTVSRNAATTTTSTGYASTTAALHLDTSSSSISGSRIFDNSATATSSASQAFVEGVGVSSTTVVHIANSKVFDNVGTTSASSATFAEGGGIWADELVLVRSTVDGNKLLASSSGANADSEGGGLWTSPGPTTLIASTISRNHVIAKTTASDTASAQGGGGDVSGLKATNSTIAMNSAAATSPAVGGSSFVDGAGLYAYGCCSIVDSTFAHNSISASGASVDSLGGGLLTTSGLTLRNSIIANNTATTGPDCYGDSGGPVSKGHNLIRNTAGCSFNKLSTDKVGKDPKLGALANNGGPTQTMAIPLSSPAFNAIPKASCAVSTDQRGVHRPQGPRCDIGAYERKVT
jgi:fibronectin-binding autotransporter adhesin